MLSLHTDWREMMKRTARTLLGPGARVASRWGVFGTPPLTVVRMDGGICSQMHFRAIGEILSRRGHRVAYDLEWFRTWGLDCDGRFARNYDLGKLFPGIEVPGITGLRRKAYETLFNRDGGFFDGGTADWPGTLRAPVYMSGYWHDPAELYGSVFGSLYRLDAAAALPGGYNTEMLSRITADGPRAVGIHVRRGDLSAGLPQYGSPSTPHYFAEAARAMEAERPGSRFYIFSDEPAWVRADLAGLLGGLDFTVADGNGSDRGWCDLALLASCPRIVCSRGSMGPYAAMLRPRERGTVILPGDSTSDQWLPRIENARKGASV